jgi:hypothetical protein
MKNKITLIQFLFFLCLFLFSNTAFSQAPEKLSYQSVIRRTNNDLVVNQNVRVKISILQGTISGTAVYVEDHSTSTNSNGLVSLSIGGGNVVSGTFSAINWENGPYFVKMEADPTGGTNYTVSGTSQLLSVPYALYAKNAGSVSGVSTSGCFTHYIGEYFGGGVIFHLWKDAQGAEHGLIVDLINLSNSQIWSNITGTGAQIGSTATDIDGLNNSNAIVGQTGHINSAAKLCLESNSGGQNDWYLPSHTEFTILWRKFYEINKTLSSISGATLLNPGSGVYWTSTESNQNSAYQMYIWTGPSGSYTTGLKTALNIVRAIRSF